MMGKGIAARGLGSVAACLAILNGCAATPPPPPTPVGIQLLRADPWLNAHRFLVLLNFEFASDAVFVNTHPYPPIVRPEEAHTGGQSLELPIGTRRATIDLASIVPPDAPFPGHWTLIGAYFHPLRPVELEMSYHADGDVLVHRRERLPAGRWSSVMLDVAGMSPTDGAGRLVIEFDHPLTAPLRLDDALLIDNQEWIVGDGDMSDNPPGMWTICRRGFQVQGESPEGFAFSVSIEGAAGEAWRIEDAGPLRVRFSHLHADRHQTIYADGRAYLDGEYRPRMQTPALWRFAAQHLAPGSIEIEERLGRVIRNSPGDANNDGYNESRGSYPLHVNGPRASFQIHPAGSPIHQPILEISGLPQGPALVTVEGQLVETSFRLEDGTLLVRLPMTLERDTTVSVSAGRMARP